MKGHEVGSSILGDMADEFVLADIEDFAKAVHEFGYPGTSAAKFGSTEAKSRAKKAVAVA